MLILLVVLELRKILFIRNRPEIWKLEIPPSKFFPISEDWGKVTDTKFSTDVSNTVLTEWCKMPGFRLSLFLIINGKATGVSKHPYALIGVKKDYINITE